MKINPKRFVIIGLIAILAITYGIFVVKAGQQKKNAGVEVEISQAKQGDLSTTVTGSGQVDAEDKAKVRAEISGLVTRIFFKEGNRVKKGDLLVQFDDSQFVKNLEMALIDAQALEQSRARLQNTRKNFEHTQVLFKAGAASREQMDTATLALQQEEKQVAQAERLNELKLSDAREQLAKTKIRAPRNGIVLFCPVNEGMTVPAGTELFQIGELSRLEVQLPVNELDITQIKIGQKATITQEGLPDLELPGEVSSVAPQAVQISGENTFPVKIKIDNSKGILRSGMSVDTEIVTNHLNNVLIVPLLAVLEEDKAGKIAKFVFVARDGKAIKTKVTTGLSNDSDIEIKEGLVEGESYVSGDYETILHLKDKSAIRQKKAPGAKK